MVGTAFAAFAFGPWAGAAVGVATNLTGNLMHGDFSGWGFAAVQVVGAVIWGYGIRGWFGRSPSRFLLLNAVVAVACSVVAVPVILLFFGGISSLSGAAALADAAQQMGIGVLGTLFSVNMLTSLADKLISGYLGLLIVWALAHYGFAITATVRVRLGLVQPHRRPELRP
jgi:energy-coupling factor transport system substrate-specific component